MKKCKFKVNNFITLRYRFDHTVIYIKNRIFGNCKFLMINLNLETMENISDLKSVDEISEILDKSLEPIENKNKNVEISPETEFWGHCSNLQVWAENNYNTILLHSNLAFPLLKRLTEVNDTKAKKVFVDEIKKRLKTGYLPVIIYLVKNDYLHYLNNDEITGIFNEISYEYYPSKYQTLVYLRNLAKICPVKIKSLILSKLKESIAKYLIEAINDNLYNYDNNLGVFLSENYLSLLNDVELGVCLESIKKKLSKEGFANLKNSGVFDGTRIKTLIVRTEQNWDDLSIIKHLERVLDIELNGYDSKDPHLTDNLKGYVLKNGNLIKLNLSTLKLGEIPEQIFKLKSLKSLNLSGNNIKTLPKSIENLKKLENLKLNRNKIESLPQSIGKLKFLKSIDLSYNSLKSLPRTLSNLKNMSELLLGNNEFEHFPDIILELNLTSLSIGKCIKILPENIEKLKFLKSLNLEKNEISILPLTIGSLKRLEYLNLSKNKIKYLDESVCDLTQMKWLNLKNNRLKELPRCIGKLQYLIHLNLEGNPLENTTHHILNEMSERIR